MNITELIKSEYEYLVEMRRYFHMHPEVSMQEYETCKKIEEELDKLEIPHRRVGATGVYAWIKGEKVGEGKVIALRADIDALAIEDLKEVPYASKNKGVCHACGHDGHTATLLTVAKVLGALRSEFAGEVRLFFQQGEEYGQGARLFVKDGLLEGCHRVFGAHVSSKLDVGQVALTKGPQCASCDYFAIKIKGQGAHVSTPHLGIDAAYIASQIVVSLQSIVARTTDPLDTVVVGVGKIDAGTQYNILAEEAVIEGTTRSFTGESRARVNNLVVSIAKQTAVIYGAEAEVEIRDYAAPLINDGEAVEEVREVARGFLEEAQIITDFERALGADDYADFLMECKGMYAFVGTGNSERPDTKRALHHGLVDFDEAGLLLSCELHVRYALSNVSNS